MMDGKWDKWWVFPLYLLTLPKIVWHKLFAPQKSPMAKHLERQQEQALEERKRGKP